METEKGMVVMDENLVLFSSHLDREVILDVYLPRNVPDLSDISLSPIKQFCLIEHEKIYLNYPSKSLSSYFLIQIDYHEKNRSIIWQRKKFS